MRFAASTVESLLTQSFAAPVRVIESRRLAPWFVARCQLTSSSAAVPASVIVKLLRESTTDTRTDLARVYTEHAALRFVAELGPDLVPRLWASDLAAGILIMEDLAPRLPLASLLCQGGAVASAAGLRSFARALGQLASLSVGRQDAFQARRRASGPAESTGHRRGLPGEVWASTRGFMQAIGVSPSDAVERDLAIARQELTEPGPFLVLSNGDSGPNNYLLDDTGDGIDDGRLIDFEAACYRHALEDAVCLHVPGPHWLTVSDPVADGSQTDFRSTLSAAIPQAMDNQLFDSAMAAACLAFAIIRLHRFPKMDGRDEGDPARLQLVSTLEAAAQAGEDRSLGHLRGWLMQVAAALRRRWPDSDVDLATIAPWTPRSPDHLMQPIATRIDPPSEH